MKLLALLLLVSCLTACPKYRGGSYTSPYVYTDGGIPLFGATGLNPYGMPTFGRPAIPQHLDCTPKGGGGYHCRSY